MANTSAQWNAELYNAKHSYVWELATGVIELVAARPGERILDLGCGTGHLTARIAQAGTQVVGIDSSQEMIREAQKQYPQIEFKVADARDFEFDRPFDAVFSNAALHWIREPGKVIHCVWNALLPGGRFVAEMGGKGNVRSFENAFREAMRYMGSPAAQTPSPWFFPSVAEYANLLDKQGFSVVYANLFDRPTPLEEGEAGLREWIKMFGRTFYQQLSPPEQETFVGYIEKKLRPALFRDGRWVAEYKRLRIAAIKSKE